jgi:hypothetical protein
MSLFHNSYFIKQLPNGFPSRIAWFMQLGCCSTFGKRKNTLACGSSIFTLSESLATSLVHGSRNPARKTIRYPFIHKGFRCSTTYRSWNLQKLVLIWKALAPHWRSLRKWYLYVYQLCFWGFLCWWGIVYVCLNSIIGLNSLNVF